MPGSLRIGKIAGISIEVHFSWLIIFVLLSVSLAIGWFPYTVAGLTFAEYLGLGAVASILLFVSVLAHELAHSLVARARGLDVKSITLFIFGGVSNIERTPPSAGAEFQIALVGPVVSLVIGAVAWPIGVYVGRQQPVAASILEYLGAANLLLGAFNLIPGFPLDGGRVLRSAIWQATGNLRTATRWAARVGQLVAYLFILAGVWLFFTGDIVSGLWLGFIGWFLLTAAQAESSQVELASLFAGLTVADAMNPAPLSAPASVSIQQLVDEYILPHGLHEVPVTQMGTFVGLVTLREIRRVPREQWPYTLVNQVMEPLARLQVARPEQPLDEAVSLLSGSGNNQVPVVEDGRLVGALSRETILHMLEIRRGLGMPPDQRRAEPPDSQRLPRAS